MLSNVTRFLLLWGVRERVVDEAVQNQGLPGPEDVLDGGRRVRDQDHVRLLDRLEAADGGSVESEAVLEGRLGELGGGDGEVLHLAGQVAEAKVDELVPLGLHQG